MNPRSIHFLSTVSHVKVASSQILEIIERANENKNSELVDLEKESNLWEPLEKLWR